VKLWIRVDANISSDPNVLELADRLSIPVPEAVGMCVLVWGKVAEHRPSGDVSGIPISTIEQWAAFSPRKGKPAGTFGRVFLELFVSDGEASGWHERQGALIDRAERERLRKRRGKRAENPGISAPTERNGTERDATEPNDEILKSDSNRETISEPPAPEGKLPASLFNTLPAEAKTLMNRFYEFPSMTALQRERYRAVAMQLVDVLDPKHPGPKIRGGQRVKARSPEHLADVCRSVLSDPPNDRDMAIVFVLKKLLDPEKGPSQTEVASQNEARERQIEEHYHQEAERTAIQWAKDHPDEYRPILAEVNAKYNGKSGAIVGMARNAELTQRCAKAAGFPAFEDWRQSQPRHSSAGSGRREEARA
jgi:hypothetical protein